MAFLSSMNILGSGLTVQQTRLDITSENIVNMNTTRTESGDPYYRKMVVVEAQDDRDNFYYFLNQAQNSMVSNRNYDTKGGVIVTEIVEDPNDLKIVYDPTHPDANDQGYVEYPNVDLVKEMTDAMAANQAYSANVTALNLMKSVIAKALEIGR
ncbi:MAG: flagellar basal body rod protein FlgC [Eubacteriales bacterium]